MASTSALLSVKVKLFPSAFPDATCNGSSAKTANAGNSNKNRATGVRIGLTRHKISCREPSVHATHHTVATADTPSVNVTLARGQLHRLVRCLRVISLVLGGSFDEVSHRRRLGNLRIGGDAKEAIESARQVFAHGAALATRERIPGLLK